MAKIQLPRYTKWRDGRPRWELGGRDRETLMRAGFRSQDLKDAAGQWLSWEAMRKAADVLNTRVDQWRAGALSCDTSLAPPPAATGGRLTVQGMIDAYQASDAWAGHPKDTRRTYTAGLNAIGLAIGDVSPHTITPAQALKLHASLLDYGFWRAEKMAARAAAGDRRQAARAGLAYPTLEAFFKLAASERFGHFGSHEKPIGDCLRNQRLAAMEDQDDQPPGYSAAFQYIVHARVLWTWAARALEGAPKDNPFSELGLAAPEGRVRRITDAEFAILDQAAIEMGEPGLGDAIFLGIQSAQRRSDLASMNWDIKRTGRVHLVQQKTGVTIDFRAPVALMQRLDQIWQRHREKKFKRVDRILLDAKGEPYDPDRLSYLLGPLRHRAVEIQRSRMPQLTLHDVTLHDARDTAIIMRLEAGMDIARVAEHSGHSLRRLDAIKRAYFGRNRILADQATDILDAYQAKQGGQG